MYGKSSILNQWGNDGGELGCLAIWKNIQSNLYHTVYPEIEYRCVKDVNAEI